MNENILKALVQLFALVIDDEKSEKHMRIERDFVETFLNGILNRSMIDFHLELYDGYIAEYAKNDAPMPEKKRRKRTMVEAMKVMAICEQINTELEQRQKTYVLLKLIEFITLGQRTSEKELDFVQSVANAFNISDEEYLNSKGFVFNKLDQLAEKQRVMVVANTKPNIEGILYRNVGNFSGSITFLHLLSTNTIAFQYSGTQNFYLNGQIISPNRVYVFESGSSLRSSQIQTIYFTDVVKEFMHLKDETHASLLAQNVEFKFKNSDNGVRIHKLDIDSGQLIGVMGASGAGKSTLLNVLNGNIKPSKGVVLLNGYNLYDEELKDSLNSLIGYVPQDDILYEELTVYQNLHFNAQLCLNNYTEEEREKAVERMLYDLDLYDVKDLVVGTVLKKYISGGQRKRLNIALELIREPSVLFVDEPTSGLSSLDSEIVMNLLKEQTLKGKIVIVNIHQPSSDIYIMFDKMLFIDKGGYLIYSGNPVDAIGYFKTRSNYINADEEQCFECGNVNPEQLLQIIEAKVVNEYGKLTRTRKVNPEEWFQFNKEYENAEINTINKEKEPIKTTRPPGKAEQFKIFFKRDLYSKIANKQYLLISLLEAPVLALFLGFFTKYISGLNDNLDVYVFSENVNIPAFIFMAVVVALFLGLSISAEEIIKDRKHLQREAFLGLSKNSYLNSKIILLFTISAIQMLTFVVIGNLILEIKGMTFHYWLMLFSTACFANLLGLNMSSALNSVITIYILIPFILVPQLLFSGVLVQYDKLHKSISSPEQVPVLGDIMTSRWSYEALMVYQYNSNEFEKHFFDEKSAISSSTYYKDYLIPKLQDYLTDCVLMMGKVDKTERLEQRLRILTNEIHALEEISGDDYNDLTKLNIDELSLAVVESAKDYLFRLKERFLISKKEATSAYDNKYYALINEMGRDEVVSLKRDYTNKTISDMVTDRNSMDKIIRLDDHLVQLKDPIYHIPKSKVGRAHFYAPYKRIGNTLIETYWFNFTFIWLSAMLLFVALRMDWFRKAVDSFGKKR